LGYFIKSVVASLVDGRNYLQAIRVFRISSTTANCCPDSNRFSLSYGIRNDTITVVVVDTAAHLCRCICRYVIRGEFKDLPLDHYVFACNYDNKLVYLEHVYRRIAAMKRSGVEGLCAIGKSKWKNL